MAIFIPEWSKLSGRDLHIKRTLGTLNDEHVIRRPLRPGCAADLFIEHRAKGWMVLALSSASLADVSPTSSSFKTRAPSSSTGSISCSRWQADQAMPRCAWRCWS